MAKQPLEIPQAVLRGFKPMLGNNDKIDKAYLRKILGKLEPDDYYLYTDKEDGVRIEVFDQSVTTRAIKPIGNSDFESELRDVRFLVDALGYFNSINTTDTVIELEVYIPGMRFSEINMMLSVEDFKSKKYLKSLTEKYKNNELTQSNIEVYTKIPENTIYYLFLTNGCKYKEVYPLLCNALFKLKEDYGNLPSFKKVLSRMVVAVPKKVTTVEEIEEAFMDSLRRGKEGGVLMRANQDYFNGRCAAGMRHFLKLKPFKDIIVTITGLNERLTNTNESNTDALGHSFKRNTKADKEGAGILGGFECVTSDGIEFSLGAGMPHVAAKWIWEHPEDFIGKKVIVTVFDYGIKTKPRQPVYKAFEDTTLQLFLDNL